MTVKIRQERKTGRNVVEESRERIREVYQSGDRVITSFSGGKDSTVCMELAAPIAAEFGQKLDVVMRDEEILLPGTYEYCQRVAETRTDINFHWFLTGHPVPNVFNRDTPYWWTFDQELSPDQWVRQPPEYARWVDAPWLSACFTTTLFPPDEGHRLVCLTGMRAAESSQRRAGLHSSGHYMTRHPAAAVNEGHKVSSNVDSYLARILYDWEDGDIWRALSEFKWDYSSAYNAMYKMGQNPHRLRIAPVTSNAHGIRELAFASQIWPSWFDDVCERCPGIRTATQYGERAIQPTRHLHETWQECFERTCINEAPAWVRERSEHVRRGVLHGHSGHATTAFPDAASCMRCPGSIKSWKAMARAMYMGDPWCEKQARVSQMNPAVFRPGYSAYPPTYGTAWDGTPVR